MLFEVNADTKRFQFPDRFQALRGISSEPGDRFYQHLIDASLSAIGKKSLEEIKEKIEKLGLQLGMNLSDRLLSALEAESARVRAEVEENK